MCSEQLAWATQAQMMARRAASAEHSIVEQMAAVRRSRREPVQCSSLTLQVNPSSSVTQRICCHLSSARLGKAKFARAAQCRRASITSAAASHLHCSKHTQGRVRSWPRPGSVHQCTAQHQGACREFVTGAQATLAQRRGLLRRLMSCILQHVYSNTLEGGWL